MEVLPSHREEPSVNEATPDRRFHGGANVGSCALRSDQSGAVVADRLAAIWKLLGTSEDALWP